MRLSIVVPASGPQTDLDDTLVSVLENRPEGCEVIVPYAKGYVDPYDLSDEVTFVECSKRSHVVQLLNTGFEKSRGSIVHWLLPGTAATAAWTDSALRTFDDQRVAVTSPKLVDKENSRRLVSVGLRYSKSGGRHLVGQGARRSSKKNWSVMGPTLSAGFCRRELIAKTEGFPVDFGPELADVAWAAKLCVDEVECRIQEDCELVSTRPNPILGFGAGRQLERLYWAHRNTPLSSSFVGHGVHAVVHGISHLLRPSIVTTELGRLCGFAESIVGIKRPQLHSVDTLPIRQAFEPADTAAATQEVPENHSRAA